MPPSSNTSISSPTASAIAGSARIDAGRPVQVVAAVIGHRNCRNTGVHSAFRVVDPHHALEHERSAPQLAQPGDVLPGRRRGAHPLAVGREERRARLRRAAPGWAPAGPADAWSWPSCQSHRGLVSPSGSIRTIVAQVHLLGDLRATPVAAVREAPVGGRRSGRPRRPPGRAPPARRSRRGRRASTPGRRAWGWRR